MDLADGRGLEPALQATGHVIAVINCAAISAPAACEQDSDAARWLPYVHPLPVAPPALLLHNTQRVCGCHALVPASNK